MSRGREGTGRSCQRPSRRAADDHGTAATLHELAHQLQDLNQRAALAYAPLIENLISTRCRDVAQIELTLDGLLGFCGHPPALTLYRRLCRYLWDIDQASAVAYVQHYRELWDSPDERQEVPR